MPKVVLLRSRTPLFRTAMSSCAGFQPDAREHPSHPSLGGATPVDCC